MQPTKLVNGKRSRTAAIVAAAITVCTQGKEQGSMEMSKEKQVTIRLQDCVTVVALDRMDIWDGADVWLLRETLGHLIHIKQCRNVAIDMQQVKYIEGGFFGMLCDCHDLGVSIWLLAPQPQIKRMIWFQQFFGEVAEGVYCFLSEPRQVLSLPHQYGRNGGQFKVTADDARVVLAKKLHQEKSLEIDDICKTLRISRSTNYRYVALGQPDASGDARST